MTLSYEQTRETLMVLKDNKIIGEIKRTPVGFYAGYQYIPLDEKDTSPPRTKIWPSVRCVQNEMEGKPQYKLDFIATETGFKTGKIQYQDNFQK